MSRSGCIPSAEVRKHVPFCSRFACVRGKRGIDAFRNPSENLREPRWEMAKSWKVTCYKDSTDLRELKNPYDGKNYRDSRYLQVKISVLHG